MGARRAAAATRLPARRSRRSRAPCVCRRSSGRRRSSSHVAVRRGRCSRAAFSPTAPRPSLRAHAVRRGAAARARWLHHRLKVLQRALKKAKQFEVRKIIRRLQQAKASEAAGGRAGGTVGGGGVREAAEKLTQQLEAARRADVAALALQVRGACMLRG